MSVSRNSTPGLVGCKGGMWLPSAATHPIALGVVDVSSANRALRLFFKLGNVSMERPLCL